MPPRRCAAHPHQPRLTKTPHPTLHVCARGACTSSCATAVAAAVAVVAGCRLQVSRAAIVSLASAHLPRPRTPRIALAVSHMRGSEGCGAHHIWRALHHQGHICGPAHALAMPVHIRSVCSGNASSPPLGLLRRLVRSLAYARRQRRRRTGHLPRCAVNISCTTVTPCYRMASQVLLHAIAWCHCRGVLVPRLAAPSPLSTGACGLKIACSSSCNQVVAVLCIPACRFVHLHIA